MIDLKIVTDPEADKSRSFRATLLSYVVADTIWELGAASGTARRPVWISYVAPNEQARAFTANLRQGTRASAANHTLQIPKTAPLSWRVEPQPGGVTITTGFLRDAFAIDPGMTPDRIQFVLMPPSRWVEDQAQRLTQTFQDDARDVVLASLFAAYLDRRTPMPILNHPEFHLDLYRSAVEMNLFATTQANGYSPFYPYAAPDAGLVPARLLQLEHNDFVAFLKSRIAAFFAEEIARGKTRIHRTRRLLPDAGSTHSQLCLDFAVA